ncbi:MAG: glutaredoxin domain-containing protein [Minisyncoccia bacterium]
MDITVYTTPTCPYCLMLKEFLSDNNLEFKNIDATEDQRAAIEIMERTGQMGVPITEINDEIIIEFDLQKLKEKLGII